MAIIIMKGSRKFVGGCGLIGEGADVGVVEERIGRQAGDASLPCCHLLEEGKYLLRFGAVCVSVCVYV
jgi:hypothetical protein